ncbi:hypothetical protein BOO69_13720 [Sulfitobacter alexandrii]|uniref:Uncharacterized protein n=2 Tax=Sulfitobacter alexandrii TaxID=1917485 RepID=A0A1J0WJK2_9RHOB|nr:hypothetical protein BOO69_13720 [Sulfitobacter alexandrii]
MQEKMRTSPLVSGLALLGAGLLIRRWQPDLLTLPDDDDDSRGHDHGIRRAARKSRDGLAGALPGNLTGSIARSLMIMGAGLILVRALDELVEDEDRLF